METKKADTKKSNKKQLVIIVLAIIAIAAIATVFVMKKTNKQESHTAEGVESLTPEQIAEADKALEEYIKEEAKKIVTVSEEVATEEIEEKLGQTTEANFWIDNEEIINGDQQLIKDTYVEYRSELGATEEEAEKAMLVVVSSDYFNELEKGDVTTVNLGNATEEILKINLNQEKLNEEYAIIYFEEYRMFNEDTKEKMVGVVKSELESGVGLVEACNKAIRQFDTEGLIE